MSAMTDDNSNNEGQAEGGIPYAIYSGNVGMTQVVAMAVPQSIAVYADSKALLTCTKDVLARCGGDFGGMKDLTLSGGNTAGVWSYARPTDPDRWPAFYSTEMAEVALNGLGMQGGIILSGKWSIPTMGVLAELVAATRLWNGDNATEYVVSFEPDASRLGKDYKDKAVIGSSMPVEFFGFAMRKLALSPYGPLKFSRVSEDQCPQVVIGARASTWAWRVIELRVTFMVWVTGFEQDDYGDSTGSGKVLGVLCALLGDVSIVRVSQARGYDKTKRVLIECAMRDGLRVQGLLEEATAQAKAGRGVTCDDMLVTVVKGTAAANAVYKNLHKLEVFESSGGGGSAMREQLAALSDKLTDSEEKAAAEAGASMERQRALAEELRLLGVKAEAMGGALQEAATKRAAAEQMAAARGVQAETAAKKVEQLTELISRRVSCRARRRARPGAGRGAAAAVVVVAFAWPLAAAATVVALRRAAGAVAGAPGAAWRAAVGLLWVACWLGTGTWAAAGACGEVAVRAAAIAALEALLTGSEAGARRRLLVGMVLCYVVGGECAGTADAGQAAVASGLVRVVCWNARHLRAAAADVKRAWLTEQVEASRPAVVVLCEVDGAFKAMKALRSWASRVLKYDMRFLVGEGGGATNGIVVLVDRAQGSFAGFKRLALRAFGVEVVHKADAQRRAYAAVHGVFTTAFREQVDAAEAWVRDRGGGLVLGDFNHVPCRKWRVSRAALSASDKRLRRLCGTVCEATCCRASVGGGAGRVVGSDGGGDGAVGAAEGEPGWTRFATADGRMRGPTARYDFAVAIGCEEGAWQLTEQVPAEGETADFSDHLLVVVERQVVPAAAREKRAVSVARGPGKLACLTRAGLRERAGELAWELREAARAVAWGAASQIDAVTQALVAAGREAEGCAMRQLRKRAGRGVQCSAEQVLRDWQARLRWALQARGAGRDARVLAETGAGFFCGRAGMQRFVVGAGETASSATIWGAIVRYARRQVRRSGARVHQAQRDLTAAVLAAARERPDDDERRRFMRTWGALRAPRGSPAVEAARVGDVANGELVHSSDPRFPGVLADIGRGFVAGMRRGVVVEAARAWLQVFVGQFQPIAGSDGCKWLATRELTFPLFVLTLYSVQGGKSVGPSGFSVDLLRVFERGGEEQRAFFDAIMGDLREARIPASWRTVVYALLAKPPPSDPNIIGERREIALMEQLMKVVLRAVKASTYARLEGRVLAPQLGWLQGCATAHVGIQLQVLLQQAARLGHTLYICYIDLATFFPSIERGVLLEHELLAGVPRDVLDLAAAIFGAAEAEAGMDGGVPCRYDSAAGLGDAFRNNMGALMGCVLSPARAKLFVNSVVAAIHLSVRGVRLWGGAPATQGEAWARLGSFILLRRRLGWGLLGAGGAEAGVVSVLELGDGDGTEAGREEDAEDSSHGRALRGRTASRGGGPQVDAAGR